MLSYSLQCLDVEVCFGGYFCKEIRPFVLLIASHSLNDIGNSHCRLLNKCRIFCMGSEDILNGKQSMLTEVSEFI